MRGQTVAEAALAGFEDSTDIAVVDNWFCLFVLLLVDGLVC